MASEHYLCPHDGGHDITLGQQKSVACMSFSDHTAVSSNSMHIAFTMAGISIDPPLNFLTFCKDVKWTQLGLYIMNLHEIAQSTSVLASQTIGLLT